VADRAGHLLLAGIVLASPLGVVAVSEAQRIGGVGGGAGMGGPTCSYSHTNQSFGGQEFLIERHLVQLSLAQAS
jgi:hypothetical protein